MTLKKQVRKHGLLAIAVTAIVAVTGVVPVKSMITPTESSSYLTWLLPSKYKLPSKDQNFLRSGGIVECIPHQTVFSNAKGNSKILWLIPNKTLVVQGNTLAKMEQLNVLSRLSQQRVKVSQSRAALLQTQNTLTAKKTKDSHQLELLELELELAVMSRFAYFKGTYKYRHGHLTRSIKLAEKKQFQRTTQRDWSEKLAEQGYLAQGKLEIDRTAQKSAELSLNAAREKLRVLEEAERPRKQMELNQRIEKLEEQIQFLRMQLKTSQDQLTSRIETLTAVLKLETGRLRALKTIPTSLSIRAPVSGIVKTLNFPTSQKSLALNPHKTIAEGQPIAIIIPAHQPPQIQLRVSLDDAPFLQSGQAAFIRATALPDTIFLGSVKFVTRKTPKQSGSAIAVVELNHSTTKLLNGMLVEVEISTAQKTTAILSRNDALQSVASRPRLN